MRDKSLTRVLVIFLASLIFVSCRSGSSVLELSPGEQTFQQNCQACHRLPKASDKTDTQWPDLVDRYGQKAKLTQVQIDMITSWLLANN